jgi:ankyrin repeat protein
MGPININTYRWTHNGCLSSYLKKMFLSLGVSNNFQFLSSISLQSDLTRACAQNDIKRARDLIREFGNIKGNDKDYATPLIISSWYGNIELVRHLWKNGFDLNKSNEDGNTPLHGAAAGGKATMITFLFNNGAVSTTNKHGVTPLMTAAGCFKRESFDLLCNLYNFRFPFEYGICCELLAAGTLDAHSPFDYESAVDDAFKWFKLAYIEREKLGIVKMVDPVGGYQEACSMQQLEILRNNSDEMLIQSFLINQRILGIHHPSTVKSICNNIRRSIRSGKHLVAIKDAQIALELMVMGKAENYFIRGYFDIIIKQYFLTTTFIPILSLRNSLNLVITYLKTNPKKDNTTFDKFVGVAVCLFELYFRIKLQYKTDEQQVIEEIILKVVADNYTTSHGFSMLHLATSKDLCLIHTVQCYETRKCIVKFPSITLATAILCMTKNIHQKDIFGRNALHYAAANVAKKSEIVDLLIENGLHLDTRDNNGLTPHHILKKYPLRSANYYAMINKPFSLKCLCASVIKDNQLLPIDPYLPVQLREFILVH